MQELGHLVAHMEVSWPGVVVWGRREGRMKKGFKSTVVRDLVLRCGREERRADKADE